MKTKINYSLLSLVGLFVCLFVAVSCNDDENNDPVAYKLSAPRALTPKVMGTTVAFTWTTSKDAVSYVLELATDATFSQPQTFTSTSTSYTVEALAVNTVYWTRVKAIATEPDLNSNYSTIIKFTSGLENLLYATPIEITNVSMKLAWTPNSEVTHFSLTPAGSSAVTYSISSAEKAAGEKNFTGLTSETTYNVQLYNNTSVRGEGQYTTPVETMPDLAVTATPTPISTLLTWAANERVTHFIINPAPISGSATLTLDAAAIAAGSLTVAGLKPATAYALAAFNNNSTRGSSSFTTTALPAATVTASNVTETTVNIAWTPADSYVSTLSITPADGSAATYSVTQAAASGSSYAVVPATVYSVALQYVYGGQTYSRGATTFTTPSSVPAATLTVVGAPTQTAATLSWTPADVRYTILSLTPASGNAIIYNVNGSTDAAGKVCTGLTAGTNYTARLQYVASGATVTAGTATFSTVAIPSSGSTITWNFSTFATAASITTTTTVDGLTMLVDATHGVTIEGDAKTYTPTTGSDSYTFTQRFKFNGTGNPTGVAPTARALQFSLTGNATIAVYAVTGSNGAARDMALSNGASIIGRVTVNAVSATITRYDFTYTGNTATNVYLYSENSGINLYQIQVIYP